MSCPLSRTAIGRAKQGLNDKIVMHANAGRPMQSLLFGASATAEFDSPGKNYYNWRFLSNGFAEQGVYALAKQIASTISTYRVVDEAEQKAEVIDDDDIPF